MTLIALDGLVSRELRTIKLTYVEEVPLNMVIKPIPTVNTANEIHINNL